MPLSEKTISLLRRLFNELEESSSEYRSKIIGTTPPEKLTSVLNRYCTTDRPSDPILSVTSHFPGWRLSWREQMIFSFIPPYNRKPSFYESKDNSLNDDLHKSFMEDLPPQDENLGNSLLEQLVTFPKACIMSAAQKYLAILIAKGENARDLAFRIVVEQINNRIDPAISARYIGCYLFNFSLEPPIHSVSIAPNVEIRLTTFSDVEYEVSGLGIGAWDEGDFLPPNYKLVIKMPDSPLYHRILDVGMEFKNTEVNNVITALRLQQSAYVGTKKVLSWTSGIKRALSYRPNFAPDINVLRIADGNFSGPGYTLKTDSVAEISWLYQNLRRPEVQDRLQIALERFNNSYKWLHGRERIIDLVIALENIFGEETVGQTTEVGYRLRLRAARYLGKDSETREYLMQFFSDLYTLRSKIVHGDSKEIDVVVSKKFKKPLDDVVEETEQYCRQALRNMIENPNHIGQHYLNKLLLGTIEDSF